MNTRPMHRRVASRAIVLLAGLLPFAAAAVTRGDPDLSELPGYDRYQLVRRSMGALGRGGTVRNVTWTDDGRLLYSAGDQRFVVDLETLARREATGEDEIDAPSEPRSRRRGPGRGRQRDRERSPDGALTAVCRDWNVVVENADGDIVHHATTQGTRKHRYGMASWVYGEELDQSTAMWWSPDGKRLAFYEFDESLVEDFYLLRGLSALRTSPMTEGYPKPGEPNPIARLHVFDLESGETLSIDTGSPEGVGHYVYAVRFSPDGRRLLFNRTNRWQNRLEVVAADVETGATHVVIVETQDSWQDNRPTMRFLDDGERFIWETERTGWKQLELRSLAGDRLATLTEHQAPIQRIERVDEERGVLFYTAFTGDHPLNAHLHRVGLDGTGDMRLTPLGSNHSAVEISPDASWFMTRSETSERAPSTTLHDARDGRLLLTLAESDASRVDELGLQPAEMFSFTADDDATTIYGVLYRPSDFSPERTYPLVIDVYGGPMSQRVRNTYSPANPLCELGFLVAVIDNRGTPGRGKAFESAAYLKLGTVDLADQAAGVRSLAQRPYVDGARVGIYGSSYGGYMSALAVLKHPDVFHVAVAGSAVTDWKNYDTIYTERFMRTPEANPEGYEQGSCMTFADQLRGHLLLLHGMVDDNVHPTNAWQLVERLHEADRSFEMMFYPNRGHGLGAAGSAMRIAFLHEHLIGGERVAPSAAPDEPEDAAVVEIGAGDER